ncbi:MAG: MerR family transcriptional regulator [bacterium]
MNEKMPIGIVAEMLGISIQTLRRWDEDGTLRASRSGALAHRYYTENMIEDFLSKNYKYLEEASRKWAFSNKPTKILSRFHCPDKSIFKARLSKLEFQLSKDNYLATDYRFSLVTAIIGEIGNNSFDHNIGKWADTTGVFFGYNLSERIIILADRGQGILTTLKRVKTKLSTDKEAIQVAFTEYISGRAPENRGNGLKYVREIVEGNTDDINIETLSLNFQSGDAEIFIKYNIKGLNIKNLETYNQGCFALLHY